MNNAFTDQFHDHIKFSYTCFDRIIITGYIRRFFQLSAVIIFLRAPGFTRVSKGVLRILTDQLNAHIKTSCKKHDIPIIWWPSVGGGKNGAKQAYVERHYGRHYTGSGNHVYCILTDKELVKTVASKQVTTKSGGRHNKLYQARKPVKHYYIYVHDEKLGGPCYLKMSSYLPFQCAFYFNGHHVIKRGLDQLGISYTMKDNAFTDVSDPAALQKIADDIHGRLVQHRINYWMDRFFKFDKGKYSTRSKYLKHEWYCSQVEVSSNTVFKSARYCTGLFDRLLDKFSRLGLPDRLAMLFSKRPHRRHQSKSTIRLYDTNACLKHWFGGNSIKQYNKSGYFIRTETTINRPKSLGLKKPVCYLHAYHWFGAGCNNRLLRCCADVDIRSLDTGQVARFNQPVKNPQGQTVTAPDLRNDRQVSLFMELLRPKYAVTDFKTSDLFRHLKGHFRNPAQIRYELQKLIVRGLVEKLQHKSRYRVTKIGWKWLWTSICAKRHFVTPVISRAYKNEAKIVAAQPSKLEKAYQLLNEGMTLITQEFALV